MRPIYVTCVKCKERFDERDVEVLDISEDAEGRDRVAFKCPECKEVVKRSLRVG